MCLTIPGSTSKIMFILLIYSCQMRKNHTYLHAGRLFNETGQLDIWWTTQSVNNFVERQQCFVDQYSLFSDFNISVSPKIVILSMIIKIY